MPSISTLLGILLVAVAGILIIVWWLRHSPRGLDWVVGAIPLAFALSYLSSYIFRVPDYQAGCDGLCPGWWGYPYATHLSDGAGAGMFNPGGFIINAMAYYILLLLFSGFVVWLASQFHWPDRSWRWRLVFLLFVVVLPLAFLPTWFSPNEPQLPIPEQRLANNAAKAWRWQLQSHRWTDRRLAVEDVRLHPDGERHRVCFRVYTWFYIPYDKIYVDLEPAGVRATGGGVIGLSESCWIQP